MIIVVCFDGWTSTCIPPLSLCSYFTWKTTSRLPNGVAFVVHQPPPPHAPPRLNSTAVEQIAKTLRERWVEVAFAEWVDSNFQEIDTRAFYVWATYNWWIAPWWDQVWDVTEDPFGLNSTSSSGSSSGGGGGEGVSVAIMSSQE